MRKLKMLESNLVRSFIIEKLFVVSKVLKQKNYKYQSINYSIQTINQF